MRRLPQRRRYSRGQPKRPMPAFLRYCCDHRKLKREQYPHWSNADISRLQGEDWRALSVAERSPYTMQEEKERLLYQAKWVSYYSTLNRWDSLKKRVFQFIESKQRVELDGSANDKELKRQICESLASALRNSIRCGHLESCNLLLDKFKNHFFRLLLHEPQFGLLDPLREAARKGHIAVVQSLLYDHNILDLYPDIIYDNNNKSSSQKSYSQDIPIVWLCTENIANLDVIFSCIRRQPSDFVNAIIISKNRRGARKENISDPGANSIEDHLPNKQPEKIDRRL